MLSGSRHAAFETSGRLWLRRALDPDAIAALSDRKAGQAGQRLLVDQDKLAPVTAVIRSLWPDHIPVRCVGFAKSSGTNWTIPWHQDRVIAVAGRVDVPGYTAWSQKAGLWHCEPPRAFLDAMLFVRVHIDPQDTDNGAMEIALGSHRLGPVKAAEAAGQAACCETEVTAAAPGDVLVLKMLTLHRSRPSKTEQPRRALRNDYAGRALPVPLRWATGATMKNAPG